MKRFAHLIALVVVMVTTGTDGLPSLAAASSAPSVSVRRNTALNGAVLTGDMDGDGIIDAVATDPWAPTGSAVLVALGRGDGSFSAPIRSTVKGTVLAVGDYNDDIDLDVVIQPFDRATYGVVAVMPGRGDGTLAAPMPIAHALPLTARFAVAWDVDTDGYLDVAVGGYDEAGREEVDVYRGRGDGTFDGVQRLTLPDGSSAYGAAVGDLNDDGFMDVVVADHDGRALRLFVQHAGFGWTADVIPLDRQANDVAMIDLDVDRDLDLVVATSFDGGDDLFYTAGFVSVLFNNGDATFQPPIHHETAAGAWRIVVGDFNRDGLRDVATANRSARQAEDFCGSLWDSVSILPRISGGTFGAASSFSLGNQSNLTDMRFHDSVRSLRSADLNGDHQLDLVASWGAIVLNQPADPNWGPSVTATATQPDADGSIALTAIANDSDQDRLTYQWTESGGQWIEPSPAPCRFTPATGGVHTFTVTVNDGHGHTASSSVTVDFGMTSGGTPPTVSVTAPTAGEVLDESTPYTIRWSTTSSAALAGISVALSTDDGGHWQPISECASLPGSATSCTWNSVRPVTSYGRILVTATDSAGREGAGMSGRFSVRAAPGDPLNYGWRHAVVGQVGAAGGATHNGFLRDGQAFTVSGAGADIWGTSDAFHFVWQPMTGDFSIDTIVDSLQHTHAWAKAGLMIRADATDPMSVHASIIVSPSKGVAYQRRAVRGGTSANTQGPLIAAPVWLRMTRQGNLITALYRKHATDAWTTLGRQIIDGLDASVDVGLPVTSHVYGTLATAKFSGVFLAPLPSFSVYRIGGATGSANWDGTNYTAHGSGSDIWGTADSFVFLAMPMGDSQQITARVRSIGNTNAWAKAGVMIRESTAAGSKHAMAIVSPGKGIAMQYRGTTNGPSASAVPINGAAPVWLRIRRSESSTPGAPATFQASYSTDRMLWRLLSNSISFTMAHDGLIGIAVTSHSAGVETTAVLDDIRIER
jgi:hypothetical protein